MIVDTSAIIAIIQEETGYERVLETLAHAEGTMMSAATFVELSAVVSRIPEGRDMIRELLASFEISLTPFDDTQADIAADAYRRFGRGSGHPARLNLGDTYSYALARAHGTALLYIGDDFSHTDIPAALER